MRLIFDVLHPAHVHFFRFLADTVQSEGGEVLFTGRDKDVTLDLLKAYDLPFKVLSSIGGGLHGLAWELGVRVTRLVSLARSFRPDLFLGIMGPAIVPAGRLTGVPSWVFYDTETARITNRYVYPFCTRLYIPKAYRGRVPSKARRYRGFHELAYLHPERFTPDSGVRAEAGLGPSEPFAVVRIVSWEASHDRGDRGFSDPVSFVDWLSKRIRVVVTAERGVPEPIREHAVRVPPHRLHDLLAAADLYVGEGATMAIEAAVLGVPAVFLHTAQLGCLIELEERYDLVRVMANQDEVRYFVEWVLKDLDRTRQLWLARREYLLKDCIDVGRWMIQEVRTVVAPGSQ